MIIKNRLRSTLKATGITILCGVVLGSSFAQPASAALGDGTITNSYSDNANLFSPNDVWNYLIWRNNPSLGIHTSNAHTVYASTNGQRTLTVTYDDRFYVRSRVENNSSSGRQDYEKTGTYSLCNSNAKDMTLRVRTTTNNVTTNIATSDGSGLLCTANSATVTIPTAAYVWDPDLGMYKAAFIVDFTYSGYDVNQTKIEYRMSINASGLLSYPADSNSAVKRAGGTNSNAVMYFPFGPTCTQTSTIRNDGQGGRPQPLIIYDMDNGNNDDVAGGNKEVYVRILKNGTPIALRNNSATDNVVITDEGGAGTYSESNRRYLPRAASNQDVRITLNLMPGARYQLQLTGKSLHYNNFIEVGLPSPSIYGASNIACPTWTITPTTTVSVNNGHSISAAKPGDTITWQHIITANNDNPPVTTAFGYQSTGPTGFSGNNLNAFTNQDLAASGSNTQTSTYTIPATATNSTPPYCRNTVVTDSSYLSGSQTATSGNSCVTVNFNFNIDGSVRAYSAASGGTTVTTAKPGQTVYFDYRLWNNGPDRSTNITYTTNGSAGNGSPRALNSGENIAARSSLEPVYIPTNATNGQTICRTLAWSPDTQAGGSGNAQGCVTVNFTFNIGGSVTAYSAATGGTTHGTAGQGEDRTVYVTPGTSLYFGYRLWNQAGSDTSASITYRYGAGATVSGATVSGGTAGANSPRTIPGTTTGTPPPNNINAAVAASNNLNDSRIGPLTIPLDALNSRPADCRSLAWAPDTQASANGAMARLCVQVRYNYTLTPAVTAPSDPITPGDEIKFGPSIRNTENNYTSNSTTWTIRRFIARAGVVVPTNLQTTGTFSCARYSSYLKIGTACEDIQTDTGTFTSSAAPVGSDATNTFSNTADLALGDKVCYALYINSRTQAANQQAEIANCATVAKYPALTVEQGMVRTGGVFANTSGVCQLDATNPSGAKSNILMHDYNSTARGSYGLAGLAVGRINYFGSHNEYYGKETSDTLRRSLLFANSQNDDNKGYFLGATPASTFCLPNTTSLYATRGSSTPSTTPPATPVTPTASVNYTLSNNTLTLAGGTINPGNQVVIRVTGTGTIRITGDILYGPTPTDLAAGQRVPQFILLADGTINIQIADTVTELNGIYSTKGNIYTCATGSTVYNGITSMTSDTCNQALTIKGALIANQVLPYRTAGYNDVNNTTPAETFRLTPEALIGDYQYSQDNPLLRTVRQRELPVRL